MADGDIGSFIDLNLPLGKGEYKRVGNPSLKKYYKTLALFNGNQQIQMKTSFYWGKKRRDPKVGTGKPKGSGRRLIYR